MGAAATHSRCNQPVIARVNHWKHMGSVALMYSILPTRAPIESPMTLRLKHLNPSPSGPPATTPAHTATPAATPAAAPPIAPPRDHHESIPAATPPPPPKAGSVPAP